MKTNCFDYPENQFKLAGKSHSTYYDLQTTSVVESHSIWYAIFQHLHVLYAAFVLQFIFL